MHIQYVNAHNLQQLQHDAPAVSMALGYFDGVHKGHQHVIEQAKKQARKQQLSLAVLSFFPHPKSILVPGYEVAYIEPLEQKAQKLEKLGVDIFYVVQFTKELAQLSPTQFLDSYVKGLHAQHVVCGFDYTYGHRASGTVETLAVYAATQQMGCTIVNEHTWQAKKISSTRIRTCVEEGQLHLIPELLGTYYTTKYCQKSGVLPYYSLPKKGHYHVVVDTGEALIPCMVTVLSQKTIQLHCDCQQLPERLTIQWLEHAEAICAYA